MFRATLIAAMIVTPSLAMADKVVAPDGDSYYEVVDPADTGGFLEILNPINSAQAQTRPTLSVRPSAEVPLMQSPDEGILRSQFDGYYTRVPGQP
jgi:hypothetical protein